MLTLQPQDLGIGRLFWQIRDAIIVADAASGRIVLWNPAAEALFGYTAAEIVGQPVELLVPDQLKERHRAGLARYARTGRGPFIEAQRPLELPARHRSGRELAIELTLSPIEEPALKGRFVLAVVRDLSERQRAAAEKAALARLQEAHVAAEAAQRRLALLAEASRVLSASLDYETTLQTLVRFVVNTLADWCVVDLLTEDGQVRRVATAHRDPAKEELVERLRRFPPDLASANRVARALATGQAELEAETRDEVVAASAQNDEHLAVLRALGSRSYMIVPLIARGRTLGAMLFTAAESGRRYGPDDLAFAQELAQRAALAVDNALLYRAAREAIQLRDDFLSVAAHELKTPLTGLKGYAQLLLRQLERAGTIEPGRLRERLQLLDRQANKLAWLVNQLLDVSRLEGGQLKLEPVPTDLAALVSDVVATRRRVAQHRIALRVVGPILAVVDPIRIEQVLTNLLDNAIRFAPADRPIEVELEERPPGWICLSVRDYGPGIPPELRERVFDRFFQAHAREHRSGLGLGLYISRQIVQRHGGELTVEFPPDGGTRFVAALPAGRPAAPRLGSAPAGERDEGAGA